MNDLRYPIGKFTLEEDITPAMREAWISNINEQPAKLREAVKGLDSEQLETPYRPEGWTVRQVVHHIPDSHINSYVRFKWALSEDAPTIKAYDEQAWAELPDSKADIALSLDLLESLHKRWLVLLKGMTEADWQKHFVHPASAKQVPLGRNLALYAWHGTHHIAQITALREREGWL